MAYIGRQLVRGQNRVLDDISSSFNGSTTAFNLTVSSSSSPPASVNQLWIIIGGILQKPGTDFTVADAVITFTTAPASTLSFWGMIQGDTSDINSPADASVTPSKIANSGDFAFPADVRFKDADASHYVGLQAPSTVSSNLVWTLPAADGSANQVLKTDGSGALGWASDANAPEGTAVLSTGETGTTKYLRVDGDNTCSWQLAVDATKMPLAGGTFTGDITIPDKIIHDGDTNTALRFPSADTVTIETAGTERLRVDSSGDTSFSGNIQIPDTIQHTGDTNTKIRFPGADTFAIETAGSERLRIDSNGKVKIGTTATPTQSGALNVFGTDDTTSQVSIRRGSADAGAPKIHFLKSRNTTDGSHTVVADDDALGQIMFAGNDGAGPENGARISAEIDGTPGGNDLPTRLVFSTTADGSASLTERLRIDSSGNIGLGITNPNLSGYGAPVVSLGHNSTNNYAVLELTGNKTSNTGTNAPISTIVGYNVGGSSRIAAINFCRYNANNNGAITFETYSSGSAGERLVIDNGGDVKINDGNLVIGTAGHGIDFSANSHASGMTGELLDDYERGTWTPAFDGYTSPTGVFTYSGSNSGKYTKIGNQVTIWFYCAISNMATLPGGGYLTLKSLPFTNGGGSGVGEGSSVVINWWDPIGSGLGDGHNIVGFVQNGQTRIIFGEQTETAVGAFSPTQFFGSSTGSNASYMYGFATYIV